jgi:hypothetical protein
VRIKWIAAVAVIAAAGAVVGGIGTASAAKKAKKISCTFTLTSQEPPTATSGEDFGFVKCPKPFGKGLQYDKFTVAPATTTTGTASGPFKDYFDTGTTKGLYKLNYTVTGPTSVSYTGTFKYSGGTAAFKHAKGSGTLTCTSPDGVHTTCTSKGTFTGI